MSGNIQLLVVVMALMVVMGHLVEMVRMVVMECPEQMGRQGMMVGEEEMGETVVMQENFYLLVILQLLALFTDMEGLEDLVDQEVWEAWDPREGMEDLVDQVGLEVLGDFMG